jgi:hypothetical protein
VITGSAANATAIAASRGWPRTSAAMTRIAGARREQTSIQATWYPRQPKLSYARCEDTTNGDTNRCACTRTCALAL